MVVAEFPAGTGFVVSRYAHDWVGIIEIFHQFKNGRFASHLSDDWDLGIRVRGSGEEIAPSTR